MTWHNQSIALGLIFFLWFGCGTDDRDEHGPTGGVDRRDGLLLEAVQGEVVVDGHP